MSAAQSTSADPATKSLKRRGIHGREDMRDPMSQVSHNIMRYEHLSGKRARPD